MSKTTLSIGELAKLGGVATSLLRYYEKEGLLEPLGRTASGYRYYAAAAIQQLLFIRKAQRYGFSLQDIKLMRGTAHDDESDAHELRQIAESRLLDIERRFTELLVLRHEMEFFLDDVSEQIGESAGRDVGDRYRELLERACGHTHTDNRRSSLRKLSERLGCNLAKAEWESLLEDLRGEHVHLWQNDDDGYSAFFASQDSKVVKALEKLAASETGCNAHIEPRVEKTENGTMLQARGENSFLFAQLFLALEARET